MPVFSFGGTSRTAVCAKAGENIIPKVTTTTFLRRARVTTDRAVGVTIVSGSGPYHGITKKETPGDSFFEIEWRGLCQTPSGERGTITAVVLDEDIECGFEYET